MDYEEYIKNMDEFTKSALLETFNIGASRAADALSEMLGHPVTIEVPQLGDNVAEEPSREGWRRR